MDIAEAFAGAGGEYRRPVVLLSYAVQAWLGLSSPAALHAANALLHGLNAGLVVVLVGALLPACWPAGTATLVGLAAGLLFAGHPVASGSVAYVSGRTDLLATFFVLVAVAASVRAGSRSGPAVRRGATAIALASIVAAGLSKESGLMAGPLAAAVLWWRRSAGVASVAAAQLAAPLLAALAIAGFVLPPAASAPLSLGLRLRGVGTALATSAGLLWCPRDLHLDRLTPLGSPLAGVVGIAALAASAALAVRFVRAPSRPLLAAVALVLLLAPGAGFIPVYPAIADRYVFTGEQFLYAPLAVLAAVIAVLAARTVDALVPRVLPSSPNARLHSRSATPKAAEGRRSFRASPGAFGSMLLAMTLTLAGMPVVLDRQIEFSSAETVYRKTLAHSPSPRACFNLGNLHLARRQYAEAVLVYERCVAIAPGDAAAHGQLAVALQQLGRTGEARRAYERSIALDSRNPRVWSNFATLDANERRYAEAREKWRKALELDPRETTAAEALERLDAHRR